MYVARDLFIRVFNLIKLAYVHVCNYGKIGHRS